MNWKSPRADEVEARAVGLKLDSIFAGASSYSKLVPVVLAACLIAPAIRTRDGSTPAVAVASEMSTDIGWCPAPREKPRSYRDYPAVIMVNGGLKEQSRPRSSYRGSFVSLAPSDMQLHIRGMANHFS